MKSNGKQNDDQNKKDNKMNNDNKTCVITRKFTLIPEFSDMKEWKKKVTDYIVEDCDGKIEYFKSSKCKKTDNKKERISHYEKMKEAVQSGEITKEMVTNYTYCVVREAMESEARRKNYILSWAFSQMKEHGVEYMDFKDQMKFINEMIKPAYRVKGSKKGSLFDDVEINSILNGYGTSFSQEFTSKLKSDVKDGLLKGKVSLRTYKLDSPFTVAKDHISLTHDYDSYEELCEHIGKPDCKLYFNFGGHGNPTICRFTINTGTNRNKEELYTTLLRLYSGEYQMCGSSIQLGKNGNKIILNLSMEIPVKEKELDEDTVVGVDMGVAVPAMCALNNDPYKREACGDGEAFLNIRTKIQSQRRRLQKGLRDTAGGHGRKKKLQALEKIKKREANFVESYCHLISRRVVDFALANNAKYINIENLAGYDTSEFILRNWSYYKLQQYITYKAAMYGIVVRKVNPCYTSQVCSECGHWEEGQRKSQEKFECGNSDCKSHTRWKRGMNADFNAARNIAKSTLFMESGQVTAASMKKAREYYGIPEKEEDKQSA